MQGWTLETRVQITPAGRALVEQIRSDRKNIAPEPCPNTCGVCGIANIHGAPSCFDECCPNRLPELCQCGQIATVFYSGRRYCQTCVDCMREHEARNFSDGRGDCCR